MKVSINKYVILREEQSGENFLQAKATLQRAKKEGILFFREDVSSLTEKETMNLYHMDLCPNENVVDENKAFPVPLKDFFMPRGDEERFQYFKKYFESYYPTKTLTYDAYKTFNKTPYIAKKCVWFYS